VKARSKIVAIALLARAFLSYFGVFVRGRQARTPVVDAVVYGASLTADGRDAVNTNHFLSFARWTISPLERNRSETRGLFWRVYRIAIVGERPRFVAEATR